MDDTTLDNPSAVFASAYPYIALPAVMWATAKAELSAAGFLCFGTAFNQLEHCEAASTCSSLTNKLSDFTIIFAGEDEHTYYDFTLEPSMYLLDTDDSTHCEALIS